MNVRQVIPKDAIPSIDEPTFDGVFRGDPDDRVVVPDLSGAEWRAYPLRILNFHEIANDRLGSVPIAVTWCPLCGTIVVFDRRVDGHTLTLGVSGKLAEDNLVMYDRETGSEFKQSLGRCIDGPLEGTELSVLPAVVTSWAEYSRAVEEPRVLSETDMESEAASDSSRPARIDYDREPYREYFDSPGFGLDAHRNRGEGRTWDRDDIDPKTTVLGIGDGSEAVAVPRPWARVNGNVAQISAGSDGVVVFATASGMYAYEDPGYEFVYQDDEQFLAEGTTWHAVTGESADGGVLSRVPAKREFAFTWQDDHGPDRFAPEPDTT